MSTPFWIMGSSVSFLQFDGELFALRVLHRSDGTLWKVLRAMMSLSLCLLQQLPMEMADSRVWSVESGELVHEIKKARQIDRSPGAGEGGERMISEENVLALARLGDLYQVGFLTETKLLCGGEPRTTPFSAETQLLLAELLI
ncbi:unnamed protein product [Symbiodinium sp. CCMP2592]|nr:unnamed protein product [Symbiodinium sp. CCMP2592]